MKLGLLWYDADRRLSPQARLAEAASRFAQRFGRPANCCHVHPEELFADPAITVRADPSVLKHHFWVGRDEALEPARPRRGRKMTRSVVASPMPSLEALVVESPAVEAVAGVTLTVEVAHDVSTEPAPSIEAPVED